MVLGEMTDHGIMVFLKWSELLRQGYTYMNRGVQAKAWKVSLHGGHSAPFCDHARNTLKELLEAAVDYGYHTFGVTEHAPRVESRYLYEEEVQLGWTVETLDTLFRNYAEAVDKARLEFSDRLQVLKGFEAEVCPPGRYREIMLEYKCNLGFDYLVGSVHYVDDIIIDYKPEYFKQALEGCGGYEGLAVKYYQSLADMVIQLRPEVIGHFDLIRKGFPKSQDAHTPRIMAAVCAALEVVREYDGILDVNTAGYRKGLGSPYPSREIIHIAKDMGIPFCFGDDSHAVSDVGAGVEEARCCLLDAGVSGVTYFARGDAGLNRLVAPLCE